MLDPLKTSIVHDLTTSIVHDLTTIDAIDTIKRRIAQRFPRATDVMTQVKSPNQSQNTADHDPQVAATNFDGTQYADFRPMPGSWTRKQIYYGAPV